MERRRGKEQKGRLRRYLQGAKKSKTDVRSATENLLRSLRRSWRRRSFRFVTWRRSWAGRLAGRRWRWRRWRGRLRVTSRTGGGKPWERWEGGREGEETESGIGNTKRSRLCSRKSPSDGNEIKCWISFQTSVDRLKHSLRKCNFVLNCSELNSASSWKREEAAKSPLWDDLGCASQRIYVVSTNAPLFTSVTNTKYSQHPHL